ncbi:ADP-glyceromanno-heptose 6-epimerase [Bacteroidota bacterium]
MIVITGAAGFIGSNLLNKLNCEKFYDIVLVDDFSKEEKKANYSGKKYTALVDRSDFIYWLDSNHKMVQFIFHIGARTDTAEFDIKVFDKLNLNYSKEVWKACVKYGLPLVYASSAATYGLGENGFNDDHDIVEKLEPLNPYGESKNDFDKWALKQVEKPYFWAGLKFFNVYGPNEYHKGRMSSVILSAYKQIKDTGKMKLFRSHRPDFNHGEQKRDFIYVFDVVDVMYFFLNNRKNTGIYNLGTGKARTFKDLVISTFTALKIPEKIEYIDTPKDIRENYQYFTEANMSKLRSAGYDKPFISLEKGIEEYVIKFLLHMKCH